jgi:hypothetical protein
MSDLPLTPDASSPLVPPAAEPVENVGRGLLLALAALIGGVVLTVVLFEAGFLAAISGLVMAGGAVFLYSKGAGRTPKRGLVPLATLIVVFLVVGIGVALFVDVYRGYDSFPAEIRAAMTRGDFIREEFNHYLFQDYGKDIGLYFVFAALGVYGTFRRMFAAAR